MCLQEKRGQLLEKEGNNRWIRDWRSCLFVQIPLVAHFLSCSNFAISVLLGVLYLYGTWKERRKRRKGSSTAEENEPLSDGVRTVSDCEKGITKASESKKHDDDGHVVRPPYISAGTCEMSTPLTTFPCRFHHRRTLTSQKKHRCPERIHSCQISQAMVTTDPQVSPEPAHLSQCQTPTAHPRLTLEIHDYHFTSAGCHTSFKLSLASVYF